MSQIFYGVFLVVISMTVGSEVEPDDITVAHGQTANLVCQILPGISKISWTSENIGLISEDSRILSETGKYVLNISARYQTLFIKNVEISDEGLYTCNCSGKNKYEMKFRLHVEAPDTTLGPSTDQAKSLASSTKPRTTPLEFSTSVATNFPSTTQEPEKIATKSRRVASAASSCNYYLAMIFVLTYLHKMV